MSKTNAPSHQPPPIETDCDVAILGGGPAGAAAAITLAREGHAVVVIEKSRYEEARIGETLPPSAREPLERLGVWDQFLEAAHVPSPGLLSVWADDELDQNHCIFNPYGHGWHLDRRRFDTMLAHAACRSGARLYNGAHVTSCPAATGGEWQVAFTSGVSGRERRHHVRAAFLLDATGRTAVLARQHEARRINDDRLVGLAGSLAAPPGPSEWSGESGPDDELEAYTLVEACPDGWWYSALVPPGRFVAIYMTDADLLPPQRRLWGAFWKARLQQAAHTCARLQGRTLQAAPRVFAANSSRLDCIRGRGWLAVGDAAMAFDPLSSQGLVQALASGIRAGEALNRQSAGEAAALVEYDRQAHDVFRQYSRQRAINYGREKRWPGALFWQRRHAAT